jgi:hypothetical protein
MDLYNKSDMQYTDYQWTAYPKIIGNPDSASFNKFEGFEVLDFINALAELWGFKSRVNCMKMEKMIREKLPSNIITQDDVKEWIKFNWDSH